MRSCFRLLLLIAAISPVCAHAQAAAEYGALTAAKSAAASAASSRISAVHQRAAEHVLPALPVAPTAVPVRPRTVRPHPQPTVALSAAAPLAKRPSGSTISISGGEQHGSGSSADRRKYPQTLTLTNR